MKTKNKKSIKTCAGGEYRKSIRLNLLLSMSLLILFAASAMIPAYSAVVNYYELIHGNTGVTSGIDYFYGWN